MLCAYCDATRLTAYHGRGPGEGPLCRDCAERDILDWTGEMDQDEHQILDQRIIQAIQDDPKALRAARSALIIAGLVDYDEFL